MNKLKFIVVAALFIVFSLFMGFQAAAEYASFAAAFFITLIYSAVIFMVQVEYYIFAVKRFAAVGAAKAGDFQHPLDIWLIAIPLSVLMVLAYTLFKWHIVEVFYCTALSLTGMLFGNALGRGEKKWSIKKSLPFFFGVAAATIFAFIAEAVMQ